MLIIIFKFNNENVSMPNEQFKTNGLYEPCTFYYEKKRHRQNLNHLAVNLMRTLAFGYNIYRTRLTLYIFISTL
jgi:hypothetical protein